MAAPKGNKFSPGRPADYNPDFHDQQAYRLCLIGKTAEELAESFGIARSTIKRWFKEHPSFWDAVSRGREQADALVAEGLFKRATGFEVDTEKHFVISTGDFRQKVEVVQTKTYFPPDPGAAMNWLKNRQPEKWREKQEVGLSGDVTFTLNLDGDTPKPESDIE